MTPTMVVDLGSQAIGTLIAIASPLFLVALGVGLVISIFQAATQINEQTLTFVPKLIAILVALVVAGPWMITTMTDFARKMITSIPTMIG